MQYSIPFKRKLIASGITCLLGVATTCVAAEDEVEEVVVIGIRNALSHAVDIKRDASSVVDAISAEDIGKLPDTTIADSLQRVTGIQIRRSAGEGSKVNVRGTPQVSTLLNGEQFLSAGAITTAQPDFTDIPAELLSRVDVIKSSQAKTLSGGVSGTIDLKTRRPRDLDEGFTIAGSAEMSDGSFTDDTGNKLSAFAGFNNGDNFGALVAVSASNATLANFRYGMFNDWWFRGYHEDGSAWPGWGPAVDVTGDGDTNDAIFGTIDYGVTNKTSERDRLGFSATAQFQATDKIEIIGDLFYTSMDQFDRTNGLVADNAWASYDWVYPVESVNRGPSANGNTDMDFYTTSVFNLDALRVTAKAESHVDKRTSLNLNLQANILFSERLSGSVRFLHGNAENKHTGNFADAFITTGEQHELNTRVNDITAPVNPNGEGPNRIRIHGDMSGTYPSFSYPEGFGDTIEKYGLVSSFSHQNRNEESKLNVLRFDGQFKFDEDNNLEFGYRYGERQVTRYQYDYAAPFTRRGYDDVNVTAYSKWKDSGLPINGIPNQELFGDTIARTIPFTELQEMGFIHQVSDFGPASDGHSYYFINPKAMEDALAFHNALYPGNVAIQDPGSSYIVDDTTHTVYLQGNFAGEFGVPYTANYGIQIVRTNFDITKYDFNGTQFQTTIDGVTYPTISGTPAPVEGELITERHETDVLPRFNIGFETSENTKLRFAYTKTMTQLDANDLGLGRTYTVNNNATLGVFQADNATEQGNPYMEPWRADNFDITLEWYFNDAGIANIGVYRLDIATAITTRGTLTDPLPDSDGVMRKTGPIDLTIRENTEGGVIQGIELGYQQAFDTLPGAWSGLGTTLNYTWADSEGGEADFYGKTMPMGDNSEHQVNAILWYEYAGIQARLAYNYRSKRFIGTPWNDGHPAAWWTAPTTFVDASISYEVLDNVTVYLQGTNITEEYENTYLQWSDVMVNQNVFEARYSLGVRAKL